MTIKKENNQRSITGMRALVYTKYADKFVSDHFATPKERNQYFEAIKTLRALADKYGEINGIDIDSLKAKLIIE